MADFEYFRAEESDQFSFFRIPKALFTEKEFASLSTDAKLLYGILLDRISLSKKNGWIDGDGCLYYLHDRRIAGAVANVAYDSDKASL